MIINTPIGKLLIETTNDQLTTIGFCHGSKSAPPKSTLENKIAQQLQQYFKDPNYKFQLPLEMQGTPFQQRAWQALQNIPAGKTKTYGELAKELNTSARAIGNACRKNPIVIIIPCHRVIAKNSLGGFAGQQQGKMLDIKSWLLGHENSL